MPPHPDRAALSAILRRDDRHRGRRGGRSSEDAALATRAALPAALSRRFRLSGCAQDVGRSGAGHARFHARRAARELPRSEEHTSELQSLMRISYAVFCLKKNTKIPKHRSYNTQEL